MYKSNAQPGELQVTECFFSPLEHTVVFIHYIVFFSRLKAISDMQIFCDYMQVIVLEWLCASCSSACHWTRQTGLGSFGCGSGDSSPRRQHLHINRWIQICQWQACKRHRVTCQKGTGPQPGHSLALATVSPERQPSGVGLHGAGADSCAALVACLHFSPWGPLPSAAWWPSGRLTWAKDLREIREEHPRWKPQCFYNAALETFHHFCHILLIRSKSVNPPFLNWRRFQRSCG